MKFEIHFEYQDGVSDFIIIERDTIVEIKKIAHEEIQKRNAKNFYSIEIDN